MRQRSLELLAGRQVDRSTNANAGDHDGSVSPVQAAEDAIDFYPCPDLGARVTAAP